MRLLLLVTATGFVTFMIFMFASLWCMNKSARLDELSDELIEYSQCSLYIYLAYATVALFHGIGIVVMHVGAILLH